MAKNKDSRIDSFRDEALGFITEHFGDMQVAFKDYIEKKQFDKAVNLYMKLADKVIPSLPTQEATAATDTRPAWAQKIDKAKKTIETAVKDDKNDEDK